MDDDSVLDSLHRLLCGHPHLCVCTDSSFLELRTQGAGEMLFQQHLYGYWSIQQWRVISWQSALTSTDGLIVVNIVTDVVFALLPIPVVWKLQVNKRTKITLTVILGLGFLYLPPG